MLGRAVAGHVPPIALAFLRWTFATALILPFAWRRLVEDWPVVRARWPLLLFFAAAGGGSFNTLSYIGLNHTTALNALLLQSSGPVLIVLVSYLAFRDRLGWRTALGIAVSLSGVLTIIGEGDFARLAAFRPNVGDLWILAAMTCWAVYTAFLRKRPPMHWLSFTAVLYGLSALVNVPFFLWEQWSGRALIADWTTFGAIAYVSVFPSVLAYIFYNRGVQLIGAGRAGVFLHLVPFFGAGLAIALLGEALRTYHVAGFALILAGVALAARRTAA